MPSVLIPIADGIEELETVSLSDTLRRAGCEITLAAVAKLQITASRGLKMVADALIEECSGPYDLIVLPGGMPGAENLRNSTKLKHLLIDQAQSGRLYAAICASPAIVLAQHGLLDDKQATCFPAYRDLLAKPLDANVVVDGSCVTSQGPGTALEFALTLIELLCSKSKRDQVAEQMLVNASGPICEALAESIASPLMFVDNEHIVRYMNAEAAKHYRGGYALMGSSIFNCHSSKANERILEVYQQMQAGLDECEIINNAKHVVFMRAVRSPDGRLMGYYERYEPPRAS